MATKAWISTYKDRVLAGAILTGGGDKPYAVGLALALASERVGIDFVASDHLVSPLLGGQHACELAKFPRKSE